MIKVRELRSTDYADIEGRLNDVHSLQELQRLYEDFVARYTALEQAYCFTESFDKEYVFEQLGARWEMRGEELFGIPYGVKDVFNTKVLPTSMGSEVWKGFHAGNNARIIDEITERGGVIFSKTTTAEFAVHYIQAGRTVNPYNSGHITGTSSAGSAVAVACGALPVCLGTQTAGSIIRPASFCGVYGFKPSFGAFDRTGTLKTTDTLDTIGLLGSDIYGLRKSFVASFQKDPQYPIARKYFAHLASHHQRKRLKVGVVAEQFRGYAGYDLMVKEDFRDALKALADDGVEVSAVEGADFINEIHQLHQRIYCKSLEYYFQAEARQGTAVSEVMQQMIALGSQISVKEYVDALERQPEHRSRFDSVFADYDFIVTPSTASPAPEIGTQEREDTCLIWTFLGYPALSIPAFRSLDGLPFGLQLVGPKFSDLAVLDFGNKVTEMLRGVPRIPDRELATAALS